MKKKGMSDLFKYLFVAIAGIVVLGFFVRFAFQQVYLIESASSTDIRETLNDYFNALSSADNMVTTARLNSKVEVNYPFCGQIAVRLKEGYAKPEEYNHIIFSPGTLEKEMFIWAKRWDYPFYAASFFYLTSSDTKIYLVGSSKLANELVGIKRQDGSCCIGSEYIEQRFNVEKVPYASDAFIREKAGNYKKVIFVFFDQEAARSSLDNVETRSIKATDCESESDDRKCRGTINFGDKQMFFAGKPMLYAAIFAEDSKNYECGFNAAVKRLDFVNKVYEKKRMLLDRIKPECGKYGFSVEIDGGNANLMYNSMNALIQNNNYLVGGECAKLF